MSSRPAFAPAGGLVAWARHGLVFGLLARGSAACLPDNPDIVLDDGATTTADGGDLGAILGPILGCPDGTCHVLLVSQTLDDRVEILAPDDPEGVIHRGTIDLDLEPNACAGCGPGDYAGDRLDEPYGLALAGGHLHVVLGHYPSMDAGTLLSFPVELFGGRSVGETIARTEFFSAGAFSGVTATALQQLEPIFVTPVEDKLLVAVFNNNLFSAEDAWTRPGRILVLDAADPAAGIGVVDLGELEGGPCIGAGEIAVLGVGMLGVACDGNDAVARVSHGPLEGVSPLDAAASFSGARCDLPGAMGKRVRHLAGDGTGGFVVAEGPADLLSESRIWHFDPQCQLLGVAMLPADGDWQLGDIAAWPGEDDAWLFASGSVATPAHRGVFVARQDRGTLTTCGPVGGFDELLVDPAGDPLQPYAIALSSDGAHVALGAGPFMPPVAGPGFGRVLWATLPSGEDPCVAAASVIDLTAGGAGAPAVDPVDPATFRRAPNVITLVEVGG